MLDEIGKKVQNRSKSVQVRICMASVYGWKPRVRRLLASSQPLRQARPSGRARRSAQVDLHLLARSFLYHGIMAEWVDTRRATSSTTPQRATV